MHKSKILHNGFLQIIIINIKVHFVGRKDMTQCIPITTKKTTFVCSECRNDISRCIYALSALITVLSCLF